MEVGAAGAHLPDQEEEGEGDNQVEERLEQVSQLIFEVYNQLGNCLSGSSTPSSKSNRGGEPHLVIVDCGVHLVQVDAHIFAVVDKLPLLVGQQVSAAHLGQVSEGRLGSWW